MSGVVAGIGCRKGAGADAILSAVDAALTGAGLGRSALSALATSEAKASEPGIEKAARSLSLPLLSVPDIALREAEPRVLTRSAASLAAIGVSSLSEAAALAAAGPRAQLLFARVASGTATCALAQLEEVAAHHGISVRATEADSA